MGDPEIKSYEAFGGEIIDSSAAKALALAQKHQETVLLRSHGLEVEVTPEDEVSTLVDRLREMIRSTSAESTPLKLEDKGSPEEWRAYEAHVEALDSLNTVDITTLFEWFEELYELQTKIFVEDKKYAERIIKALGEKGYVPNYEMAQKLTIKGDDAEQIQWIIGQALGSLEEYGIVYNASLIVLRREKDRFRGAQFQPRKK